MATKKNITLTSAINYIIDNTVARKISRDLSVEYAKFIFDLKLYGYNDVNVMMNDDMMIKKIESTALPNKYYIIGMDDGSDMYGFIFTYDNDDISTDDRNNYLNSHIKEYNKKLNNKMGTGGNGIMGSSIVSIIIYIISYALGLIIPIYIIGFIVVLLICRFKNKKTWNVSLKCSLRSWIYFI